MKSIEQNIDSDGNHYNDFLFPGSHIFTAGGSEISPEGAEQLRRQLKSVIEDNHAILWCDPVSLHHVLLFDSSGQLIEESRVPVGNLELRLPIGSTLEKKTNLLTILPGHGCNSAITFGPSGEVDIGALPDQRVDISLEAGHRSGYISFLGDLPVDALEASVRYFFPQQSLEQEDEGPSSYDSSILGAFRYPIFTKSTGSSTRFQASVNPANPSGSGSSITFEGSTALYATNFRTILGSTVSLSPIPNVSKVGFQWDPAENGGQGIYYSVLSGDWLIGLPGTETESNPPAPADLNLMLGMSGVEFAKIGNTSVVRFVPGSPSYAPAFLTEGATAPQSLTSSCPDSPIPVTTTWISLLESGDSIAGIEGPSSMAKTISGESGTLGYYSQPQNSELFSLGVTGNFLGSLNIRIKSLSDQSETGPQGMIWNTSGAAPVFPAVPYAGIVGTENSESISQFRNFETAVLTPVRFNAIVSPTGATASAGSGTPSGMTSPTAPVGPTGPTAPTKLGVTPQGLLSIFDEDLTDWETLTLAQTDAGSQVLQLTEIEDLLRAALLSNQLFLVVSSPNDLQKYCSVRYWVTDDLIDQLKNMPGSEPFIATIEDLQENGIYAGKKFFQPAVEQALGEYYSQNYSGSGGDSRYPAWGEFIIAYSELATLQISGWSFDVSPHLWANSDGSDGTIFIIKFADGDLESMIDDLSLWTLADAFNSEPAATQNRLQSIIKDAKEALAKQESDFEYFVDTVLGGSDVTGATASWNGILFLDAYVPPNKFPPQLEGLAAGIKSPNFRAHHIGVNLSSIKSYSRQISINDSTLFGLIYYQDLKDLTYQGAPYDFKVLTLRVLFANSQITAFSSQIELLVAELFGERSSLKGGEHGDNIILNGIWQKHGSEDSYVFVEQNEDIFTIDSQVLDSIAISKAQFITIIPDGGFQPGSNISTRFLLWGGLRFKQLEGFDLFSFGPPPSTGTSQPQLAFSNMYVSMSFNNKDASSANFAFDAGEMVFDPSSSLARSGSLYSKFPLSVSGMLQSLPPGPTGPTGPTANGPPSGATGGTAATPSDLGYLIVDSPLTTGTLGQEWYGLEMELSLGTRGALAGQATISATLLAAWAPSQQNYNVAVGLKLPGSNSGKSIQIAGPLKLDIADIMMNFSDQENSYSMKFQNIALDFLGLKFPPGGQTNMQLFGDPDPQSDRSTLGWYAAYKKDEKKGEGDQKNLQDPNTLTINRMEDE